MYKKLANPKSVNLHLLNNTIKINPTSNPHQYGVFINEHSETNLFNNLFVFFMINLLDILI